MRILALSTMLLVSAPVMAAEPASIASTPTVTVQGEAEVSVAPDQALVVLGVEFEAEAAAAAQTRVNTTAQAILRAIRAQGVAEQDIQTSTLQLMPVLRRPNMSAGSQDAVISGYRARNTVRIRLRDLTRVGPVIDAGLEAGANRLEGVTFDLSDDQTAREHALRRAVEDAASRANAIARALGMRLAGVREVQEGGVGIRPIMLESSMMRAQAAMPTPVSPGEVSVTANVTVRYALGD